MPTHQVVVADTVLDREGHLRWVVAAAFVGVEDGEPRCIDYRVRVVPEMPTKLESVKAANRIIDELNADLSGRPRPAVWDAAASSVPPQGIPRHVFERASQSRLLRLARDKVKSNPRAVSVAARKMLEQAQAVRPGRPAAMSLRERLAVLATAEGVFADPAVRAVLPAVAKRHNLSPSAVRDMLYWARHQDPPLFTNYGSGRRGGELTEVGRRLLAQSEA